MSHRFAYEPSSLDADPWSIVQKDPARDRFQPLAIDLGSVVVSNGVG